MNSRENAFIILENIFESKLFANLALKKYLKCESKTEKAFATEIVYGVMRYKMRIDYVSDQYCQLKNERVRNILRVGVYQLLYMLHIHNQ